MITKFYKPIQKFETDYSWDILMGNSSLGTTQISWISKLLVCFSIALLKSFSKHMITKFYKPIQKFETDYSWDILMGNKLCLDIFLLKFCQWRSKCPPVEIWLKFAECHICCKKVLVLWSRWLVTCFLYLGPMIELQQRSDWLRFDIQFSIFWKFSAHLSVDIFTGTILPGFSNKVRYIFMHSQEDQFYLKWFVTWT